METSDPGDNNMIYVMLLCSLAPLLYELPLSTAGICAVLLLVSFRQTTISFWVQQVLALATATAIYLLHGTLQTPEAACSLIAVAVCLKTLSAKTHRDQMILLLMNLLLVMSYVLFSQTLLSTLLLFTNYIIFILQLLNLQKQKLGLPSSSLNFKQLLSPETLIALPLLISLFIFFPRFTTPWGGPGSTAANQVMGFSEDLNPGQIQSLSESENIAFRIIFKNNRQPNPELLYFRGAVLSRNKEWSWKNEENKFKLVPPTPLTTEPSYEILLEPRFDKILFTLDSSQQISLQPEHLAFTRTDDGEFTLRWSAQSKIKINGFTGPPEQPPLDKADRDLLQTEANVTPRMQQLIDSLKNKTEEEKLKSLLKFFGTNDFKYSTQTPVYPSLDDFLFGERIGFCEHFAASFAVIARLAGLPARVVTGFQGAEYNSFGAFFVVRDKHAHAWNEVYSPAKGWTRVDVTDLVAPARIRGGALYNKQSDSLLLPEKNLGFFERGLLAWDAVNNRFNLMLMNYNLENQVQLIEQFSLSKIGLASVSRVFMVIVVVFLIVFWKLSWGQQIRQDDIAKGYLLLNQKIQKLGIRRASYEGPNDLRNNLLKLHEPPVKILDLLERYMTLRFGPNASPREAKRFYKDAKALKVYK
jgi:transglutaminase-like putative cysteine protease